MGKGGGGGHTPYEQPDDDRSKQRIKIVEVISEGEIKGLVNGVKSVYLNKTPIQNAEGDYNFKNLKARGRIGVAAQSVMHGFNASEKEVSVGVEVKKANSITRTVNDEKVTRLRITVGVKALFEQKDNGDTVGTRVDLSVGVGDRAYTVTFDGKHSGQYLRQIVVTDLPETPFNITVTRINDDSKSQRLQNTTLWASYTEVIDTELTYPNTAVVGMMFDSDYFNGLPQRNYEIYGIKVQVPSNYDPVARTYDGLWNGTFKLAWTNNPAWVFYDLMTNKRYGMGNRLGEFGVDKWALYAIAQYCDVSVPDGFGGEEPRMTCNCWITEQRQAYEVINDLASVFRAMPVWNGQQLTAIQDRPADPVWTYTNANVVEGVFERSYSALKARHNAIHVEYLDAHDFYERKIEYVADDALIKRFGLNTKKVTAFGCTSRGQAHRLGKWILETEKLEKETITFKVGREGLMHLPGDIIKVADNFYAGTNIGGRVVSVSGQNVTLDREVTLNGESALTYINADAQSVSTGITRASGNVVTLKTAPQGLQVGNVWSLATAKVQEGLYKAIAISEEGGIYTITALQHEPQKERIVDNGAHFEPRATTLYTGAPQKLSEVAVAIEADGITLTWAQPSIVGIVTYEIKLYRDGKLYRTFDNIKDLSLKFEGLPNGHYTAVIRAKNQAGQYSEPTTKSFDIDLAIKNLVALPQFYAIGLSWDLPKTATMGYVTELWANKEENNFDHAEKLVDLAYPQSDYTISNVELADTYHIFVRLRDTKSNTGEPVYVMGQSDHNPDNIVTMLEGQITRSQLGRELINQLQATDDAIGQETRDRIAALQSERQARIQAIQNEASARGTDIRRVEEKTDNQTQLIETATARADEALSGLQTERTARAEADRANAEVIETATAKIQGVESAVESVKQTIAEKDRAQAENYHSLSSRFDNLSIGGRNLIRNSDRHWDSNEYLLRYPITVAPNIGDEFIVTLWGNLAADRKYITVYNSRGYGELCRLSKVKEGVYQGKGRWALATSSNPGGVWGDNTHLNLYFYPSSGVANSQVERVKFEIGTVATDWSPAPEDVETTIAATNATITALERTVTEKDRAQASRVNELSASLNSKEEAINAKITAAQKATATLEGKVNSTYTLKTEAIAGGRKAIAGIALGATADNNTAESQVIVMADKFGIVKNKSDGNVQPVFSVVGNKVGIRGDLIVAGSVSPDQMRTGQGGNLIPNPIFSNNAHGWTPFSNNGASVSSVTANQDKSDRGNDYYLPNENRLAIQINTNGNKNGMRIGGVIAYSIPVEPNKYYVASCYLGAHRCEARVALDFRNSGGGYPRGDIKIDEGSSTAWFDGGLRGAKRAFIVVKAPPNANRCDFFISAYGTQDSHNAIVFAMRPMLEECTEFTKEPSAWQNAGVTEVHGGSIIADTIEGRHIKANQRITSPEIFGGSLNIGDGRFNVNSSGEVTIRKHPDRNIGLVIKSDYIAVYDGDGRLRVKLGRL